MHTRCLLFLWAILLAPTRCLSTNFFFERSKQPPQWPRHLNRRWACHSLPSENNGSKSGRFASQLLSVRPQKEISTTRLVGQKANDLLDLFKPVHSQVLLAVSSWAMVRVWGRADRLAPLSWIITGWEDAEPCGFLSPTIFALMLRGTCEMWEPPALRFGQRYCFSPHFAQGGSILNSFTLPVLLASVQAQPLKDRPTCRYKEEGMQA